MPPPARILRGVKNIRTHFGSPGETTVPYKMYMVITALEMELYRKEKERENLCLRLTSIDMRIDAIKAEKAELLAKANPNGNPPHGPPVRTPSAPQTQSGHMVGGFKFQY